MALDDRQPSRKPTSLFERLPRVYEELGELQDRVEDEAKKRDELEAHVLTFTRDNVRQPNADRLIGSLCTARN